MPLFDAFHKFSDEQSLGGEGTGTVVGTNELQFEITNLPAGVTGGQAGVDAQVQAYPDKGSGSPLVVRFLVTTTFTSGGGGYVAFALCFDTTTKAGGTSSGTIQVKTAPISVDLLVAGVYIPELKIPDQHARYCNVNYVISGATIGVAGKVSAFLDIATGYRHR